jgi:cytochrome c553
MRNYAGILPFAFLAAMTAGALVAAAEPPPPWAFAVNPPAGAKPAADDGSAKHVPDSTAAFTLKEIKDLYNVPDWHPDNHPAMPDVVAHGPRPGVFACGFCHLPNGLGRPENSSLAGLPAAYIAQQVADFKSGARKSSEPASLPVNLMIALAKGATEAEVQTAAEYFATLKPKPWIRVVESDTVPKTHVAGWMLVASEPAATEPIGQRIIEMPENLERTELRDSASGFVAYVPVGSVEKGKQLATTGGGGKTTQCSICHGADLKGLGPVPALAGRSPSYIVRQLYDMQHGTRNGQWTELMKGVVAHLTEEDLVALAAYTASMAP